MEKLFLMKRYLADINSEKESNLLKNSRTKTRVTIKIFRS